MELTILQSTNNHLNGKWFLQFSNYMWRWDGKYINQFFLVKNRLWNILIFSPYYSIYSHMLLTIITWKYGVR